jgi:hypothetical protein
MGTKGLVGEFVQFAGLGVVFDLVVEQARLKLVEPGAELGELLWRELRYGFLNVFYGGYRS